MASMTIRWHDDAKEELRDIWKYIAERSHSDERASEVAEEISRTPRILSEHPFAGPSINEDPAGELRQLICYSYRIVYRADDDEIVIIAVVHGARLLPPTILRRK